MPGFLKQQEPRITRVMPEILENLEISDMVVTRNSGSGAHLRHPGNPEDCYREAYQVLLPLIYQHRPRPPADDILPRRHIGVECLYLSPPIR